MRPSLTAELRQALLAGVALLGLVACQGEPPPSARIHPRPEPPRQRGIIEVWLQPATGPGTLPREVELRGLVTLLTEIGLADLPDVDPRVEGVPVSSGLRSPLLSEATSWTGTLALSAPTPETLQVDFTLCDAEGACSTASGKSALASPTEAVAQALVEGGRLLNREAAESTVEHWYRPLSADSYAVLMTGRSAATLYGLRDPPAPADVGDHARDPMARAVYLDPAIAEAWWPLGRRAAAMGDTAGALAAAERAVDLATTRLAPLADRAALLAALGRTEDAAEAWRTVRAAAGRDPRFVLAGTRALVAAGALDEAEAWLDVFGRRLHDDPDALEVRVALSDARGRTDDALLASWQDAARKDPTPVRRRLRLRLQAGAYAEALPFTDELARRGDAVEANRLVVALAVAVRDWPRAEAAAATLGDPGLQARIHGRALLEADPAADLADLAADPEPAAQLARGTALMAGGDATGALAIAERLLQKEPWRPEALALAAVARARAGDTAGAARARARLAWADPEWPVSAPRAP